MNSSPVSPSPANPSAANKAGLRQQLRERRRQLTSTQQRLAATGLCRILSRTPAYRRARVIALYFSRDGELSPHLLARQARRQGKITCYPVLKAGGRLSFRRWNGTAKCQRNRFGIPEPRPCMGTQAVEKIDLVLMPLVGFDRQGRRLGMGGGFYDRTFAGHGIRARFPVLIGLAHGVQECDRIPADHWDIPLDAIATEARFILVGTAG